MYQSLGTFLQDDHDGEANSTAAVSLFGHHETTIHHLPKMPLKVANEHCICSMLSSMNLCQWAMH